MSDDDIDDNFDDDFSDGGFDDFENESQSLGDIWRNNPLVKIGAILLGLAIIIGGIMLFGGDSERLQVSRVNPAREVNEAPGTNDISETYRQAIEEENTKRVEDAQRTGTSALPMPTTPSKGMIGMQEPEQVEEDPLERWRRMQEKRIQEQQIAPQAAPAVQAPVEPPVDTVTPAINALGGAMGDQMGNILGAQRISPAKTTNVAGMAYLDGIAAKEKAEIEAALAAANANSTYVDNTTYANRKVILPAGTIEYAQIVTAVSTDAPGPVLAEVVTGPLKGSRAIGTFSENYSHLTLNFNSFIVDGVNFPAQAVAIDPNTTLPGVVTNIDRRYFSRIVLPAAAEFIEGFASALADSGRTTVTVNNDGTTTQTTDSNDLDTDEAVAAGIEEAGTQIADAVEDRANQIKPLLEIAPGTAVGILFVQPVYETPQTTNQTGVRPQTSTGTQFPANLNTLLQTQ